MRELLYKIEWPSIRQLCIGILCTYWHSVPALTYSVIESTQSPWDSGSQIDTWHLIRLHSQCIGGAVGRPLHYGFLPHIDVHLDGVEPRVLHCLHYEQVLQLSTFPEFCHHPPDPSRR